MRLREHSDYSMNFAGLKKLVDDLGCEVIESNDAAVESAWRVDVQASTQRQLLPP